jgi:DNA-binding transcriptional regulator PaaX
LQSSDSTLDLKEIAEKTGQNYKTLRMTVSRMHEAGLIAHPFRGRYTTLEQDAESKKMMEERQKARELEDEAFDRITCEIHPMPPHSSTPLESLSP